MNVTIYIDTFCCKDCGACVEECPEVFYMDESTERVATREDQMELTECIEKAVAICPTKCIEVIV